MVLEAALTGVGVGAAISFVGDPSAAAAVSAAVPGLAWLAVLGLGLRRSMVSRIGGTTGDTAGALIELLEAGALLAICAALPAAPPPA